MTDIPPTTELPPGTELYTTEEYRRQMEAYSRAMDCFRFHPANEYTGPMHDAVRLWCGDLAQQLWDLLPSGRHKSLALTQLQEVMMWANASIANDFVPPVAPEVDPTPPAPGTPLDV